MKTVTLTYIGSFAGTSKKGNEFTLSHFYGEPSSARKGISGFDLYDFFLDKELAPRVLALKPLQKISVDYLYANGSNIMINFKTL